jgi:hypothetical protein
MIVTTAVVSRFRNMTHASVLTNAEHVHPRVDCHPDPSRLRHGCEDLAGFDLVP